MSHCVFFEFFVDKLSIDYANRKQWKHFTFLGEANQPSSIFLKKIFQKCSIAFYSRYNFSKFVDRLRESKRGRKENEKARDMKLGIFNVYVIKLYRDCAERRPPVKRSRCRSVDFIAQEIPVRGTSIRGSVLYFTCRDMRRALLHRVHERSPAFNDATYAEIKYSTARSPGRTARSSEIRNLDRDGSLLRQHSTSIEPSKFQFFQRTLS